MENEEKSGRGREVGALTGKCVCGGWVQRFETVK